MEQLNRLSAYFNERDRKRLQAKVKESSTGLPEMSPEEIKLACLENNGYEAPELNDKLYLHFRGFKRMENLEPYSGCKAIWLDSNGFYTIESLGTMKELRCLYLSKNLIQEISGLDALVNLTILDLSYNRLTKLSNLSCCPLLQTLNVSHNYIATPDGIEHLQECVALTTLDLTNNRLEANEDFLVTIKQFPALVALSVNGNEITKLHSFRKRMIANMPKLGYLDRPVEELERRCAEAFVIGGIEAENQARQDWRDLQTAKRIQEMHDFKAWQAEQAELRAKAREEGRTLIREFTVEEQTQRQEEAEAAAKAEKELLDMGIDKLAGRYWQVENNPKYAHQDPLDIAAKQLLQEQHQKQEQQHEQQQQEKQQEQEVQKQEEQEEKVTTEIESSTSAIALEEVSVSVDADDVTTATIAAAVPTEVEVVIEADDAEEEEGPAKESEAVRFEAELQVQVKQQQQQQAEAAEHAIRQQRIQDSMTMYKQQLQEAKQQRLLEEEEEEDNEEGEGRSGRKKYVTNTWHAAVVLEEESEEHKLKILLSRPLYWTESMDLALAKAVKSFVYDFDAISTHMITLANEQHFAHEDSARMITKYPEVLLTNERCRLRWSELDANHWCVPAIGITAQDTLFVNHISTEMIEQTGGIQPSYDALAAMTSGAKPNYLKMPTTFPSVQDVQLPNDKEGEEEEDQDYDDLD